MIPPVANRFVAGETPAEVLEYVRQLNAEGISAMINRLGSHYDNQPLTDGESRAQADLEEYQRLAHDISNAGLEAALSVKPTQLGLSDSEERFHRLFGELAETAAETDVFCWLDMEEHSTREPTLEAFVAASEKHGGGVGVCLQTDLTRTPEDVDRLADVPGKVRFVKGGSYGEPPSVAYTDQKRRDRAYREVLEQGFRQFGDGIAVATHDPAMIDYAKELHQEYGTDFEFQMLMGVRPEAQRTLATTYPFWQYVPYGTRWKRWFINRAKNNVPLATRAVAEQLVPARVQASLSLRD